MSKHTPGPWSIYSSGFSNTPFLIAPERDAENVKLLSATGPRFGTEPVAEVFCDESPRHSEMVANARLIAAAPELLQELKAIIAGWDSMTENVRQFTPWEEERARFIRQIIAKAEGRKK